MISYELRYATPTLNTANLKKGKITSCRERIECFTVLIQCSEDMPSASSFPAHVRISKLKRDLTCGRWRVVGWVSDLDDLVIVWLWELEGPRMDVYKKISLAKLNVAILLDMCTV